MEKKEKCFIEIKLGRNKDQIGFQLERDEKTIKIKIKQHIIIIKENDCFLISLIIEIGSVGGTQGFKEFFFFFHTPVASEMSEKKNLSLP